MSSSPSDDRGGGAVCVLDPAPYLEVTVERGTGGSEAELHLHPAGQGFWVARIAARLGADVTLVAPLGGETGQVLGHLIECEGLRMSTVVTDGASGSVVHDRRSGDSEPITLPDTELSRHDRDDLHGGAFSSGVNADVFVLAGSRTPVVDHDLYQQLAADLRSNDITVVADLSGDVLAAALAGGVDVLKISDDQLRKDGYLDGHDNDAVRRAIDKVRVAGAANVVVSRSRAPSIAAVDDDLLELRGPDVDPVDSHGGGDSMPGALAAALARGERWDTGLRLAMAAGIAGVLRHGLASARRQDVERLAQHITVTHHGHTVALIRVVHRKRALGPPRRPTAAPSHTGHHVGVVVGRGQSLERRQQRQRHVSVEAQCRVAVRGGPGGASRTPRSNSPPSFCDATLKWPNSSIVAQRVPRTCAGGTAGTLTLRMVNAGWATIHLTTLGATTAAVSQCHRSPGAMLNATPWLPKVWAVSAAPTVPE